MNHAAIVSLAFGVILGCGVGTAMKDKPKKIVLPALKSGPNLANCICGTDAHPGIQ